VKIGDYVILVLALLVTIGFSVFAARQSGTGGFVEIRVDGETYLYPLDQDRELEFEGPLGHTHVEIVDGRAHVTDSPCRDKVCVSMGWVQNQGDWTACLPNRVFVTVQGAPPADGVPDAIAR